MAILPYKSFQLICRKMFRCVTNLWFVMLSLLLITNTCTYWMIWTNRSIWALMLAVTLSVGTSPSSKESVEADGDNNFDEGPGGWDRSNLCLLILYLYSVPVLRRYQIRSFKKDARPGHWLTHIVKGSGPPFYINTGKKSLSNIACLSSVPEMKNSDV